MRVHQVLDKCWFSSNLFTFTVYFETCSFAPQCMFLPDEYDATFADWAYCCLQIINPFKPSHQCNEPTKWLTSSKIFATTNLILNICRRTKLAISWKGCCSDSGGGMPEVSPPASAGAGHDKRWLLSTGVSKWRGAEVAASSREAVQAAGGCRESGCWSAPDGLLRRQLANWRRLRHLVSPAAAISGHQLCNLNITWEYVQTKSVVMFSLSRQTWQKHKSYS